MMTSFQAWNWAASDTGQSIISRKMWVGSGSANSLTNSHRPRSMNVSIMALTVVRILASSAFMRGGENTGARIWRYLAWSGGSISSGMTGRSWPMLGGMWAGWEEKSSGCEQTKCTSSYLETIQNPSCISLRATGHLFRSSS